MSTWPLVATQPMVLFQFSFFLNVDASFVTGIEPRGMHILSKWSVTVLHPKSPSHGSFHLSPPTLSLFSLHFPLTSHLAARPPFYYTFSLLDFETALKITKSSHCSMPTALALLRGICSESPQTLAIANMKCFFSLSPKVHIFLCVQGIQHPKTNSVLFIRLYL